MDDAETHRKILSELSSIKPTVEDMRREMRSELFDIRREIVKRL